MKGRKLLLRIKTLTEEVTDDVMAIEGFKVSKWKSRSNERLELPKIFSIPFMPVEKKPKYFKTFKMEEIEISTWDNEWVWCK